MKDYASLYDLFEAIPDEQAAINYFKAIRWAVLAEIGHSQGQSRPVSMWNERGLR